MKHVFFLLCCLFLATPIYAQTATPEPPPPTLNSLVTAGFTVDNSTPLLGEPFFVTITVDAPDSTAILNWPTFDPPMVVIEEGDVIESDQEAGLTQYTRTYEVVLWEVGEYLSPGVLLTFEYNNVLSSVAVSSFYVQVPAQIVNFEEATLRPAVAPIYLPYISPWVYVGIITGFVIGAMIIARVIQVSQRGMVKIVTASPAEKAIAELEDLKEQKLPAAAIYELVANNLRQYIEGQYEVEAVEMTTVEVIGALRQEKLFHKAHRRKLQSVLEQADLVKFARFQPDDISSFRLINYAIKWLKETERMQYDG